MTELADAPAALHDYKALTDIIFKKETEIDGTNYIPC